MHCQRWSTETRALCHFGLSHCERARTFSYVAKDRAKRRQRITRGVIYGQLLCNSSVLPVQQNAPPEYHERPRRSHDVPQEAFYPKEGPYAGMSVRLFCCIILPF